MKSNQIIEEDTKKKVDQVQDSLQYNSQDLDQVQNVDVKPFQFNTQNFNAYIDKEKDKDYSATISGITYIDEEENQEILSNVTIKLFYGNENKIPVYKTESNNEGKFIISEIPPGYYTIYAYCGKTLTYKQHCLKVLPCQKINVSIFLKYNMNRLYKCIEKNDSKYCGGCTRWYRKEGTIIY